MCAIFCCCCFCCCTSMFACCDNGGSGLFHEVPPVAQCSFTEDYLSEVVTYTGTTAVKIGVFTAVW
jgi:hypothetical protein